MSAIGGKADVPDLGPRRLPIATGAHRAALPEHCFCRPIAGCKGLTSPVYDSEERAERAVAIRWTPRPFKRSYPVVSLSLTGRPLPGLGSLTEFPAKSDLLGKFAALLGVFGCHHRIIIR